MGEEYQELMQEFDRIYGAMQKRHNLRSHTHFDIYGNNFIEIWEYEGERKGRCICRVREESGEECYRRAIELLKIYGKKEGKGYAGQKAG